MFIFTVTYQTLDWSFETCFGVFLLRKAWRYQMCNHWSRTDNAMLKSNRTKGPDKYLKNKRHKSKDWATRTPLKPGVRVFTCKNETINYKYSMYIILFCPRMSIQPIFTLSSCNAAHFAEKQYTYVIVLCLTLPTLITFIHNLLHSTKTPPMCINWL